MISPRLALHDLDPYAWRNAQRMLLPPSRTGGPRRRVPPPLVLFIERGQCVKVLRPGHAEAPAPKSFPWGGAWSLGRLRREAGAPVALAVEDDALERIAAVFEAKVEAGEDIVAQSLHLARAVRAEIGRGLHLDPDPLQRVPIPPHAALQKTFDTLVPDGRAGALFVFDERARGAERVWTSVIFEKQGGDVVRVTTHAALGVARPEFRQGAHRELLAAIEARIAKPHVAAFMTLDAWREVVSPSPGALAKQVAMREVVIDPLPPWMVALTGVGAMAGVAQEASRLFGRFVPQVVKDTARAVNPFAALGFDPIAAFIDLRKVIG